MSPKKAAEQQPDKRETAIRRIESLIARKRKPLDDRLSHIADIEAEAVTLGSRIDAYVESPTAAGLKTAREAETELVALRSLLERLPRPDVRAELENALDNSFEAAADFFALTEWNDDHLSACKERAREFRVHAASLDQPNQTISLQAAIYTRKVEEAIVDNTRAKRWIHEWSSGNAGAESKWRFWPIYQCLRSVSIHLHITVAEVPLPDSYVPVRPTVPMAPVDEGAMWARLAEWNTLKYQTP